MFIQPKEINEKKHKPYPITVPQGTSAKKWFYYYNAYTATTQLLIEKIPTQCDAYIIPLMFLIRHTFELLLKSTIVALLDFLEETRDVACTHDLSKLTQELIQLIEKAEKNIKLDKNVKFEINIFKKKLVEYQDSIMKIDKLSYTFRYPTEQRSNQNTIPMGLPVDVNYYVKILAELQPLRFTTLVFAEQMGYCY